MTSISSNTLMCIGLGILVLINFIYSTAGFYAAFRDGFKDRRSMKLVSVFVLVPHVLFYVLVIWLNLPSLLMFSIMEGAAIAGMLIGYMEYLGVKKKIKSGEYDSPES
ncbi:MAG: hypothetical protein WCQ00_03255 [bacterium]